MHLTLDAYGTVKRLPSSSRVVLYEAVRCIDNRKVLIKTYSTADPVVARRRLGAELQAMQRAAGEGVPRIVELDEEGEIPLLVQEWIPGQPVSRTIESGPLDIATWLRIACESTRVLEQIHASRILHKAITPCNIRYDASSARVWICNFSLAVEIGARVVPIDSFEGLEIHALRYVSPEQTGRMNRGCDARSDLYSLGATLYHAIAGVPPFTSSDELELVHAHIARVPASPRTHRPEIPEALSEMVLKLLKKEPLERYQSAQALHLDLLACIQQVSATGSIHESFQLPSGATPNYPTFPTRPIGRDEECATIYTRFEEATAGRSSILVLEGPQGVGKSTVVDQLRPRVARSGGYLVKGKFDSYSNQPYSGWTSALSSLAQQLLIESDTRLSSWRRQLRHSLGPTASALVEVVPDFRFILGDVPPSTSREAHEAQTRISLAVQRLVATCASLEHPLVLFLDDLHASDPASRTILLDLASHLSSALLLILAYPTAGPP